MAEPEASSATLAGPAGPAPAEPSPGATGLRPSAPHVQEWAGELTDRVVSSVGWVKSRTTVPAVKVLRGIVYGFVILAGLVTAGVLGLIGVVRIWDVYLPLHPLGRRVWLGYVVVGGLLFLAGAALPARRAPRRRKS